MANAQSASDNNNSGLMGIAEFKRAMAEQAEQQAARRADMYARLAAARETPPEALVADEPKLPPSASLADLFMKGIKAPARTLYNARETASALAGDEEARKHIAEEPDDPVQALEWNKATGLSGIGRYVAEHTAEFLGSAASNAAGGAAVGALGGLPGVGAGALGGLIYGMSVTSGVDAAREAIKRAGKSGVPYGDISGLGATAIGAGTALTGMLTGPIIAKGLNVPGIRNIVPSALGKFVADDVAKMTPAALTEAAKRSTLSTAGREALLAAGINAPSAAVTEAAMQLHAGQDFDPQAIKDAFGGALTMAGVLGGAGGAYGAASRRNAAIAERARRTPEVISALDAENMRSEMNANAPTGSTGPTIPPFGPPPPPSSPNVTTPSGGAIPPVATATTPVVTPITPPTRPNLNPKGLPWEDMKSTYVDNRLTMADWAEDTRTPPTKENPWGMKKSLVMPKPPDGVNAPQATFDVTGLGGEVSAPPTKANLNPKGLPWEDMKPVYVKNGLTMGDWAADTRTPPTKAYPEGEKISLQIPEFPPAGQAPAAIPSVAPNVEPRAVNTNVPEVAPKLASELASRVEPVVEAARAPEVIADSSQVKAPAPIDETPAIKPTDITQKTAEPVAEALAATPTPIKAGADTVTPVFNFLTAIQEGGGKTPSLATVKKIARENEVNVRENPDGKPATVKSILEDLNTHVSNANGKEFASRYTATGTIPTLPPRPTPSVAPTAPPTRTPEQIAKSVEKVQGVLENLKKASKTGENLHSSLVDALNNQDLSHEQVAAAFNIAHTLNQVLPGNAKHNIQFVHELFAQPQQAGALAKSGGTMGESVQGSRMAPTAALEGLIKISLEGKHSSYLVETASHEAFHVLQDYFAKHDPKFARALDNGFKSKDGSGTLTLQEIDPTIIRKLERTKAPDGESYWKNLTDSIGNAKLSPREAQAYAFGALFDAATRGKPMAGVLPVYARFINMVKEFAQRAGNALRGDGFRSASDVMEMGVNGKAKARYDAMESPVKGQPIASVDDTEFSARKPKPVAAPTAAAQASATTPASGATQASGPTSIGPTRPVPALPGERGIMRQIADKISGQRFKTYTKDLNGGPVEQTFFEALFRNTVNAADPLRKYEASRFNAGKVDARSAWEAWERSSLSGARNDLLIAKGAASFDNPTGEIRFGDYAGAKGLGEILHGTATDKIQPLQDYLIALRERDVRASGGKGMFNLTNAEINSRISGAEPEFVRIASDLDVFNKAQMKFAVDTGLIDQATADRLNSMFFTPFYRAIEADATKASGHIIGGEFSKILNPKSSSNAKQPNMSAFQKMQGSDKGVGGLLENLMRNSEAIMNAGLKNDAARRALNMMQEDGLAVKLPPKYPVTKDVIVVRENGKNVKYNIQDPLLYSVFMGAPPAVRGAFHGAMASYGRFLRTSITSTPMFLINSLWKGKLMAYVQEGSKAFTGPITEGTLAAIKKGLMDGASQQAIRANTGYGQGTFGMGSGASHEKLARATRISAGEATFMDKLHQVGAAIEKVNSSVEMAERIRIYEDAVKKGESIPHAAQEAYRMAPYSRRGAGEGMAGELISYLAPIVPFLNAKIQSNFRIWETTPKQKRTFGAYGLPEGMFTRLAVLTAFSTAAAVYSSQDPRWDTITPEEKADKDQIVIPGMPIIAIPRAFEMGIPAGLSVLAFDAIRKDLPPNYAQMLATIYGKTIGGWSDFVPPALKMAGEIAFNHSTFTGRPLESKTSANLPVSERTGPNVTATATALAHATGAIGRAISGAIPGGKELEGISPTIMQHLLENAVGALGAQAMIATDIVLGANGMLKGKPDGAFGSPTSFTQGAINATQLNRMIKDPIKHRDADTEKFYEIYGNVAESVALLGRMQTTGNTTKYQELIKDPAFMKQHQMGQALKPFAKRMTEYNNAIAQVENSKMDSAKMREEILRLQGMRAQLANQAMRLYTQYENSKR